MPSGVCPQNSTELPLSQTFWNSLVKVLKPKAENGDNGSKYTAGKGGDG